MKALILAAGRGTRLGPLSDRCPKPLLDLAGRPIIEWIIAALRDAGIRDFVVVTGHLAEMIEAHLGDGSRLGVQTRFIRQWPPRGTGQAVNLAREALGPGPFLMTYGDIVIAPHNYTGILDAWERRPCDLLIGLNWVEDPAAGAAVHLEEPDSARDPRASAPAVTDMIEKPPPGTSTTHWNSAGLMIFTPPIFEHTARLDPSRRGEFELTDAIRALLAAGRDVRGFCLSGLWSDVGTPEDLERTRAAWPPAL